MSSYKNSKLQKVEMNSTDGTTGAIETTDVEGGEQDLNVTVADSVQDVDQATVYTVSRLEGQIAILDYDAVFVDTMDDSNTVEQAMTQRNKIYVRVTLQGGVIELPDGTQWIQVRPVVYPDMDAGTDDDLVAGMLEFTHSEHDGVQRPA